MKLSEKIYACRKKQGFSQEALAEKLGVSRQAVSKWETAEAIPELTKIPVMAKIFGVTADWLLSEDEDMPISEENTETEPNDFMHEEEFSSPAEVNEPPKPSPYRGTWAIGIVIAVIGGWLALVGGAVLLINSFVTGVAFGVVKNEQVDTWVDMENEVVCEDGSVSIETTWNIDPEKEEELYGTDGIR